MGGAFKFYEYIKLFKNTLVMTTYYVVSSQMVYNDGKMLN
jgi:hypothetical protein